MDFGNHPCFSIEARHKFARIHLPVAPACNMQCKYCNRKMDCVNESRPGVTSVVLTPEQASDYFDSVYKKIDNISVAGIAGPGDPFANPEETLETLTRIRRKYPDITLCVATNGLEASEYTNELADLNTGHVTVTVNAIDPEIGSKIYNWARYAKRMYQGKDAAGIIIEKQEETIRRLKEKNIIVKINTVIIPGINDMHAAAIAEKMSSYGVEIQNCIPLYHVEETEFENFPPVSTHRINEIRRDAGKFVPQMSHCARCRADAAGLLNETNDQMISELLAKHSEEKNNPADFLSTERPFIAAASMEGLLVNQHLGEAAALWIYRENDGKPELMDRRNTPIPGSGDARWDNIAKILDDCGILLVSGIGKKPNTILSQAGIYVIVMEGLISEAAGRLFAGNELPKIMMKHEGRGIGKECTGTGMGCG